MRVSTLSAWAMLLNITNYLKLESQNSYSTLNIKIDLLGL